MGLAGALTGPQHQQQHLGGQLDDDHVEHGPDANDVAIGLFKIGVQQPGD